MTPVEPPLLDLGYFQHGHATVAGWLQRDALLLTLGLHRAQLAAGQGGAVAEIGVHHGKLFIALALLAAPGEAALAVDVFERQDLNPDGSGHGDRAMLETHLARWRLLRRSTILARDSQTLTPAELLALGGPIRLFSVDGGHTRGHAGHDLALAEACLAPGGVVLLDDFLNPAWPGVTEAAILHLHHPANALAPLAICGGKLFLARRVDHAAWCLALAERLLPWAASAQPLELAGMRCWRLAFTGQPELAAQIGAPQSRALPPLSLSLAGQAPPPGLFGPGWSGAEDWGRWSLGPEARLHLALPAEATPRRLLLCARGLAPPLPVALLAGGTPLPPLLLDQPDLAWYALDLPPLPPGPLELVLRPAAWPSPASLGLSPDARPLGLALAELVVEF
jgi:hypothetical protein